MYQKIRAICKIFLARLLETLCFISIFLSLVVLVFCLRNASTLRNLLPVSNNFNTQELKYVHAPISTGIGHARKSKYCEPLPPKDNCMKRGRRIADVKCCEYVWEMNHKDKIIEHLKCTNKGVRVIGGKSAPAGEFPHMAALGWALKANDGPRKYKFLCGGSLISKKFVLTAGHCTYAKSSNVFANGLKTNQPAIVRLGGENIADESDRHMQDFKIDDIIKHPGYEPPMLYYDIALLKLYAEVIFTKKIHPACLSKLFLTTKSTKVNVTGWGVTKLGTDTTSDRLQVVDLEIMNRSTCAELRRHVVNRNWCYLADHQFCAGNKSGGMDTCQGDSGGPLQVKIATTSGSMHAVLGVTSAGYKCALATSPGIYTYVMDLGVISWIEKIVWLDGLKTLDRAEYYSLKNKWGRAEPNPLPNCHTKTFG